MSMCWGRDRAGRGRATRSTAALILLAAILVAGLTAAALADRVKTKSGQTFTGQIISQDATKVVLKTMSGEVSIPADTILSIDKDAAPPEPGKAPAVAAVIVPMQVDPADAAEALSQAKKALVGGEWVKAGGLLEGLVALDDKSFSADDRMASTGALVTCYLQVKDPIGAAKALSKRAMLASDYNDKKRLGAAAEALRTLNSTVIGGKTLGRFEEVVAATMAWKADQLLAEAKDAATKAPRLNEPVMLDKAAVACLKKLTETEVYVPGYAAGHKSDLFGVFVTRILDAGTAAIDYCTKERPVLTQARISAGNTPATIKEWNNRAGQYLSMRQAAEDALKGIKTFTTKYDVATLYTNNATPIADKLKQLEEFQYFPPGTLSVSAYAAYLSTWGTPPPASYTTTERVKINLK